MADQVNPFTPHQPIDPEFFAGRIDEIKKIISALNQTRHRRTQHVMLTGERGIGKSSLAIFAKYIANRPNEALGTDIQFLTAYYTVEKNQTLKDVCRGLATGLLDSIERGLATKCFEEIKKLKLHFSLHVPGVGEISTSSPQEQDSAEYLQADFVKAVKELWNEAKETHNGILLIVDEIHNLADFSGIGSFLKVVSEAWTVAGHRQIMFLIVGLPHIPERISEDDRSAPRIFSYVELRRMTREESLDILHKCLEKSGKRIEGKAARITAMRSGGFPYFLHQLGYDAFEADLDNVIDVEDINKGLRKSLVQFERMFFGKMYKSVEGKLKQKIVDELARSFNIPRKATELEKTLKIKNIHQYLKPLERDGIVVRNKARFQLSSALLAIYVRLFKTAARKQEEYDESPPTEEIDDLGEAPPEEEPEM
jgi:Cdc6-like AAA superfamily ATPase